MEFLASFAPNVDFANRRVTKTENGITHELDVWDFPGTKNLEAPTVSTAERLVECTNEFEGLEEETPD